MSNSIFYKAFAAASTVGLLAIAAALIVPIAMEKGNELEESVAKTQQELEKARKDALDEVKAFRKDALDDVRIARKDALNEVKAARSESLKAIKKAGGNSKESIWLVLRVGNNGSEGGGRDIPVALEKIQMQNMEQCQFQGALFKAMEDINSKNKRIGFACVEGK